jgi:hypothetical protein
MRWTKYVAHMEDVRNTYIYKVLVGKLKGKDQL